MGGEKGRAFAAVYGSSGSPPHGRGKELSRIDGIHILGITPAWAGKSAWPSAGPDRCQDHPRMGGEKRFRASFSVLPVGSPPHGRGKANAFDITSPILGITPAWAGKRKRCCILQEVHGDHPRVGGEKFHEPEELPGGFGSPPRRRGKADPRKHRTRQAGITPA